MAKFQIIKELLKHEEVIAEGQTLEEAVLKMEKLSSNKETWAIYRIHKVY